MTAPRAGLQGVLFDLDDTLVDWSGFSGDWNAYEETHLRQTYDAVAQGVHPIAASFEAFAQEYRIRVRNAWATARGTLRSPHVGRILISTFKALGVPEDKLDADAIMRAYQWGKVTGTVVFPDVIDALETLRACGVKLGVVTNSFQPMRMREVELAAHGLLAYFPVCRVSAADAGYLKPHPQIFQQALQSLGTSPRHTVYVGDNPVADIAGAQSAGMQAILRVKKPAPPLISGLIVPDYAVNTLNELLQVFDTWFPGWRG